MPDFYFEDMVNQSSPCQKCNHMELLLDFKFASEIKNINFGFYPYNDVCKHCIHILGTFPESCEELEKKQRHFTQVGFEPTTLLNKIKVRYFEKPQSCII